MTEKHDDLTLEELAQRRADRLLKALSSGLTAFPTAPNTPKPSTQPPSPVPAPEAD